MKHYVVRRHTSRFDRIADIAGAEDWDHDPWGTAIGLFFDVAAVLDMSDVEGDVTPEPFRRWDYHNGSPWSVPSIETVAARDEDFSDGEFSDDYSYAQVSLAVAYVGGGPGGITQADLIYAGDVLDRYTNLLRRNGKDY